MNRSDQQSIDASRSSRLTTVHLTGSRLLVLRVAWLALVLPSLGLFVAGLPMYYTRLQHPCVDATTCNLAGVLTAGGLQMLATQGISLNAYAAFTTVFWVSIIVVWSSIGLLIFLRRSDDWFALLAALALVMFNMTYPGLSFTALTLTYPALNLPIMLIDLLGQTATILFFLLFPNGKCIPRWIMLTFPLVIFQAISTILPPTSSLNQGNLPGWLNALLALSIYGSIIISQIYRYRRTSTPLQRQQTKWVAFGIITVAISSLLFGLLFTTIFPQVNQPSSPLVLITLVYPLVLLLIPVSVGFATLRYRLWDIDLIINRTLVYSLLTAFVVGFYILVVGYLGALFRTGGNLLISLSATGLVAVLFQPLRNLLQRSANRLLYGLRDEPYVVLSRLGQRLKTTLAADAVLTTIVTTVQEALKLSYAAIEVQEGAAAALVASSGMLPSKELFRLPLAYQNESVGTLIIAPRGRDEALTPADLRLLDDLAQQIGNAVHTVRLTSELQALTRDLQHSREHLVTAREEERRRLRRDLHDGLGPMLSAIMLKVGLVRTLHRRDSEATEALLLQLETELETVIGDIRRVVYNLRPPALDELGLIGALGEFVAGFNQNEGYDAPPRIVLEAPETLPGLSAAVEVAAYRIVQEAVTNVLRHAQAQVCCVRFQVTEVLQIEVSDNGTGLEATKRAGVGLASMRERAEELGGTFVIQPMAVQGTQIVACLPLPNQDAGR